MTRARDGVPGTPPLFLLVETAEMVRGNALGGPTREVRRPFCAGDGETRPAACGGTGTERVTDVAVDAAGNAYICGSFSSAQAQFGATALPNTSASDTHDAFVAKLSAMRTWEWATGFGSAGYDAL